MTLAWQQCHDKTGEADKADQHGNSSRDHEPEYEKNDRHSHKEDDQHGQHGEEP